MSPDRLTEYQRKRSFGSTPEPAGTVTPRPGGISTFVVQKHSASRLHYDFRLEHGGVLLSWAVPKGPSLNPADKRLAVHVEDHPIEYFDFEGRIPRGEYGGGTVMVWDWGGVRWLPPHGLGSPGGPVSAADVDTMLKRGDVKFELFGRKLKGAFAIVGGRSARDWLLIKKRDDGASEAPVTDLDRSVLSGRSMEEISAEERVWHSNVDATKQVGGSASFIDLSRAREGAFPSRVEPMLATPAGAAFDDPKWAYEIKLDGFRTLALVRNGKVKLLSRRGLDATPQFPELAELGRLVRSRDVVLDGEVVAVGEDGRPSFSLLQERTGWKGGKSSTSPHPSIPVLYYVFDILHDSGLALLDVPLRERRRLLTARLLDGPSVRLLDNFSGDDGKLLFAAVKEQGQEGVVAKRLDSRYVTGKRSRDWVKIKAARDQSCAVVGFTPPQRGRSHFGSLALAVVDGGKLTYAGQVGSGFDEALLKAISGALTPVKGRPAVARHEVAPADTVWVEPELVCQVKYTEWTREGVLRHATLLGMRSDKTVEGCLKEPAPG